MRKENLRIANVILLFACMLFTLQSKAQTILYQQNFDGNNGTYSNTIVSQSGTNGWFASSTASQYSTQRHLWNFSNAGSGNFAPISGRSLGMGFYNGNNPNYSGTPFRTYNGASCGLLATTTRWAHVGVSTVGYENITVEFKWRASGEVDGGTVYDYGTVNTSIDGGVTWLMDLTGGQGGTTGEHGTFTGGLYYGNSGVQTANLTLPSSRNNQANFRLAFRMVVDGCYGTGGGFIIDDIIVRGTPIPTDRTLTISESYGGTPTDGTHTYSNNSSVTATAGARPGYNIIGWTGTGSVPATGTGNSTNFTIAQNSTITWNWEQSRPTNVKFNDYGGIEQLTFNNSRINTTTPIFRLSHQTEEANEYEIEINTNPTFTGGTSWTQTFTGTYPLNTQANFTFNGFAPTISGTPYYVRARAKAAVNDVWSAWSPLLHSFTYQNPQEIPDWFQTTQAQFQTDVLSGLTADVGGDVIRQTVSANPILNPSFQTNTDWSASKTDSNITITISDGGNWSSDGGRAARMHMFGGSAGSGGRGVISQVVDLSNIEEIIFDARSLYSQNFNSSLSNGGTLRLIIGGNSSDDEGVTVATINHCASGNSSCNVPTLNTIANIQVAQRIPNQIIKFVWSGYTSGNLGGAVVDFMVDNLRITSSSSGTITSTPIHLASVQGATGYDTFKWNQTPGTGDLKFDIQGSSDGINFTNISGYTDISQVGSGEKTHDISGIDSEIYPHLRLVGKLNGEDAVLHDWSVQFHAGCANSTTWNGSSWSNGVPSNPNTKILFAGDYNETGDLVGCSLEVQSGNVVIPSNSSVTIDNEITVTSGSFTLENNASLVQINPDAVNSGNITVNRNTTEMVKFDATYWSSPVAGQNLKEFSSGTLNNRFYIYNGYNAATEGDSRHFKAVFVNDANYPMPDPIPTEWEVPVGEITGNLFNMNTYTFKPGWGYSIRVPNNWPHPIGSAGAIWEKTFTGVPHNGDIMVPAFGKYTMVGNPYPSAINIEDAEGFFAENPNVETLHFWTHHFDVTNLAYYNNNYVTYTRLGAAGMHPGGETAPTPNGKIEIGQGFVVENSSIANTQSQESWDVVFKNTMRTTERGVFLKQAVNEIERNRYWLSLSDENETKIAQILIGYMTGATYEFDHQIDGRRMGGAPLYSWIGEEKFTVQGRTLPFEVEDVVPLGFKAPEFGKFKIGLDDFDGFFTDENFQIYIRDNFMQVEHDLRLADYWFSTEEGEFPTRFEIVYKIEEVMSTQDLNDGLVKIYKNKENIVIESEKEKILSVEVYDLSGRTIHRNNKVNAHIYQVRKTSLATQILVVKVLTEKGDIVTKKVINQ